MNTSLANRLKVVRGDIPQAEFAESVGINKSSWGRYERGETEPSSSDLANICSKYGISAEWILFGEGSMFTKDKTKLTEQATQQPASTVETATCARCAKIDAKMEKVEQQRDDLMQENRELNTENRRLWKENGDLRERCATLEERQVCCDSGGNRIQNAGVLGQLGAA